MMNTEFEMQNEVVLSVYDVWFECDDGDGGTYMEYARVRAEDESHAEDLARRTQYMPHGVSEIIYRGEV
jgi:hypothetical protein